MEEQLSSEEIDAHLNAYRESAEFGELVERLLAKPDFKKFIEVYTEGYVLGQLNNASNYNDEGKMKLANNFVARAKIVEFIQESVGRGREDAENLKELQNELAEEANGEAK